MPALVKLIYKNRGLAGTWTATTAVATLPASNLADANRGKKWRSTAITLQAPTVDLGAAQAIAAVALISHNLTTSATITIKGNATNAGAGAWTFSTTLSPWDDKDSNVLLKVFTNPETFRFWRIELTDATNPDGYIEVGIIALGPVFSFGDAPHDIAIRFVDPSIVSVAPSQTPKTEERATYAEVEMDWQRLTEATVFGEIQTMLREIGRKRDGILSVFSSAPSADDISKSLTLYGRFPDLPAFEYEGTASGNRYNWGPVVWRESL